MPWRTKLNSLVFALALAMLAACKLSAQEDPPGSGTVGRIRNLGDWCYPSDEKLMLEAFRGLGRDASLYSFCQRGIFGDTGLAMCYFAGSTDQWIRRQYSADKRFKEALAKAGNTMDYYVKPSSPETESRTGRPTNIEDPIWSMYQSTSSQKRTLGSVFTEEEFKKLPGVYLRIEGMMALCRPEFEGLFETLEKREAVRWLVQAEYEGRIWKINYNLFAFALENQRTMFVAHLRRCAVDLDCRIVLLLSDVERDRLLALLDKSRSLDGFVFGPGWQ